MNIINAVWEKRNLGVTTQEVIIEKTDDINEICAALDDLSAEYRVVKVCAGNISVMWELEKKGYNYIETTINVTNDLKNLELDGFLKRIDDGISYEVMTCGDIEEMNREIEKGLFNTDRIALDPFFSDEQAAHRYICWIQDEMSRGAELYKYVYKGDNVGFFTFKHIGNDVYYPFLAGIYKKYQKSPLGMVYLYKPLVEAKKRNGKGVSTYISTNNANALRMHVQFGFTFKEMINVYVKHCN